jgi:O-antigen ligase
MVLVAGEGPLGVLATTLALPMLSLSLVRTAWLGLAAAVLAAFLRAKAGRKLVWLFGIGGAVLASFLLLSSPVIPPEIARPIADRFATFEDLQADGSANVRLDLYRSFYSRMADYPFGEGFGSNQSIVTLQNKLATQPIDSSALETYLIFGVMGGTVYVAALAALVRKAYRTSKRSTALGNCMALIFGVLMMSFAGAAQTGEVGLLQWLALGIILAPGEAMVDGA